MPAFIQKTVQLLLAPHEGCAEVPVFVFVFVEAAKLFVFVYVFK